MTRIPRQHLRPLHLKALRRKTLRSQWGERRTVDVYIVEIGIGENLRLPWVEAVADELGNELVLAYCDQRTFHAAPGPRPAPQT